MKKYIKNLSKLSMVVVSAVALFFLSFNTNAQQEPGCETYFEYETWVEITLPGGTVYECFGIPMDCAIFVIECEQQ